MERMENISIHIVVFLVGMSVLLTRSKGFESNESFILGPPLHRNRDDPPVFGIRDHKTDIDDFENTLPGNVNDDGIASKVQSHRRYRRSTDFSSEESASLVDKHNELRGQVSPEASNMEFMIWDDDLAIMAQEWSDTCYFAHGQPDNISPFSTLGQNLWLGSAGKNAPDGTGAVQAWYNEVQYYDYNTTECSYVCGHYTQVVWASSYAVGCGRSLCEFATSESSNYTNVYIITCNYGPAGNYVGSQPYDDGPSCTQCDSGVALCYNNLCNECSVEEQGCECRVSCENCATISDNCTCECRDGWYGTDCSTECADTHQYCWNSPGWPGPEYCNVHNAVPKRCPYMCGLCNLADPDFVCGSTTQMATAQVSTNSTFTTMTTSSSNQGDSSTSVLSMTSTATMTTSSPNQEDGSTSVPSMTSTATMTTSSPNQEDSSTSVPSMTSTATMTTSSPNQEDSSTTVPSMTSTATMTTSSPNQEDSSTSVLSMTSTATMTTSSPNQEDGSTSVPSMTSTATMTTSNPNQEDGSTSVPSITSTATMTTSSPNQGGGSTSVPSMTSTATMSAVERQTLSTTSHLMTTSALMGDETTFASGETTPSPFNTTEQLTISSTTEVSTSSTGQHNGESTSVPTYTNAACDDIICQNGGTLEEVSCTCLCASGYQGEACQNLESEAQYGVEITIQASIDMWQSIRGLLLRVVAKIVTDWCNINFSVCCPNQGEKNSEEILDYVNETDIAVAVGYPEETTASGLSDQSFSVMLLVTPPLSTELCNSGSLGRRRRSARLNLSNIQKRSSETEVSYLDQEALYSAVTENLDIIELELNMTIEEIVMGEVVSAPSELSAAVIVGIVVASAVASITILIGVFLCIQKSTTATKVRPISSSWKPAVIK